MIRPLHLGAFVLATLAIASCGSGGPAATPAPQLKATVTATPALATPTPLTGKVTVFAAASLTESFRTIGNRFKEANPGVEVEFNFASSSVLATQIEEAAPTDVFASADQPQMQRLIDKGLTSGAPVMFAGNLPVLVVPAANGGPVESAKDLAKPGVKLVLAGPDVPIGNYARQIVDRLAADPAYGAAFKTASLANIVSNESNVRGVLVRIELGEGDAGIVYKTDALVSGNKVRTIAVPEFANVMATYPMAVVKATRNQPVAAAFVEFVRGPVGQQVLQDAGFDPAS